MKLLLSCGSGVRPTSLPSAFTLKYPNRISFCNLWSSKGNLLIHHEIISNLVILYEEGSEFLVLVLHDNACVRPWCDDRWRFIELIPTSLLTLFLFFSDRTNCRDGPNLGTGARDVCRYASE